MPMSVTSVGRIGTSETTNSTSRAAVEAFTPRSTALSAGVIPTSGVSQQVDRFPGQLRHRLGPVVGVRQLAQPRPGLRLAQCRVIEPLEDALVERDVGGVV